VKRLGYGLLAVAAVITLLFVKVLMPTTVMAAVVIGGWLLLPYGLLGLALGFTKAPAPLRSWTMTAAATALGGLFFLTYVIYLRPDPQGGIAVIFTPIYQVVAIAALFPLLAWLFGKPRAS
jgi:hypothetical protein